MKLGDMLKLLAMKAREAGNDPIEARQEILRLH
jgi:hypothetical protein